MKFRRTMSILEEKDKKYRKKGGRLGHRRVSIPIEIRTFLEVSKGDIEWEVDTTRKTLKGKLIKGIKNGKTKRK